MFYKTIEMHRYISLMKMRVEVFGIFAYYNSKVKIQNTKQLAIFVTDIIRPPSFVVVNNEGANQPMHPRNLFSAFSDSIQDSSQSL